MLVVCTGASVPCELGVQYVLLMRDGMGLYTCQQDCRGSKALQLRMWWRPRLCPLPHVVGGGGGAAWCQA